MTYLTGALYVHPLWFYKHQHENRVRSKLFVACQQVAFSLPFAAILVNCAPSGEMHNYCTPHIIKENFENFLIHRCNYVLLSQLYCLWQFVKSPTIILNKAVLSRQQAEFINFTEDTFHCDLNGRSKVNSVTTTKYYWRSQLRLNPNSLVTRYLAFSYGGNVGVGLFDMDVNDT